MRILLAGGNVPLQRSITEALLAGGHTIRLLNDRESELIREWPAQVEPFDELLAQQLGALHGADLAVVIDESACQRGRHDDEVPLTPVDIVREAKRVGRLGDVVVVTALQGPAKRPDATAADVASVRFLLRTTPIYGITADPISTFLVMMRSLPAVPLLSDSYTLQPIWHRDLARAIAAAVSLPSPADDRRYDIGGPDVVTSAELYDRIAALIDRHPVRIPLPDFIVSYGAKVTDALHLHLPFDAATAGFVEHAAPADTIDSSTLTTVFDVVPTDLDRGLQALISELNEVTPAEGVGTLEVKRFSVDIRGAEVDARELLLRFRTGFRDVMPIAVGVEPAAAGTDLVEGGVVSMALPGRGHVQVRIEHVTSDDVIVATLRGHVLAGIVRFAATDLESGVRFEVMTCDTAANALDWMALSLGAARVQDANWTRVVQNVAKLAGGEASDISVDGRRLHGEERANVERWIRDIVRRQQTAQHRAQTTLSDAR